MSAAAQSTSTRFRVSNGACLDCAGDVAKALRMVPGVEDARVLSAAGVIVLDHRRRVPVERVKEAVKPLGIEIEPEESRIPTQAAPWWRQPKLLALLWAAALFLAGLAVDWLLQAEAFAIALFISSTLIGGFYPARNGWGALRRGRLTINTLLVAATAGAIALGLREEAAMLVVIFSLGEVLEEYVSDRARGSIRALMELTPPSARRLAEDGAVESVPIEELAPGDIVAVRPGERIPTDGVVAEGESPIDQSPITGESLPVEAREGTIVYGGSLNGSGALRVRVSKQYAETTLARVIVQVQEAQAHKGQSQRFAERFSAIYTAAIFVLAALVAIIPPFMTGDYRDWIYRALVLLVVSCSCGLVISVPVSVVAAISRAARDGILIKGGAYLEALASVRAIAFDKTGTLTRGQPELTAVVPLDGGDENELLSLAAAVEADSSHPLAGAVLAAAEERGLEFTAGRHHESIPGVGVEATLEGRRIFVGRLTPAIGTGADHARERIAEFESAGNTAMAVTDEGRVVGLIAVADRLRDDCADTVAALRAAGIERIVMLTGDNERVAAAVAVELGIDEWAAGLLPEDKTAVVKSLREDGGRIAMVGDGVNDAPALATADVGIAMGAAGTDVALETADVALMADDLAKLPYAIGLSRRAMRNIRQNIVMSLLVVACLVPAALAGWLSLTTGLLINEGTALLIIANGLRLLKPFSNQSPSPSPAP